jgi:hypothetical protein
MPEATQYMFTSRQLLEVLIREAKVHEGKWLLVATFAFSPGNFGPTLDQMAPGAVVATTHLGIQMAPDDAPEGVWVDAASINPTPKNVTKKAKAST